MSFYNNPVPNVAVANVTNVAVNIEKEKHTYWFPPGTFNNVKPIFIDDSVKKTLLKYCVASKTSEDMYVVSFRKGNQYSDYVSLGGFAISYRIFTMLLLKGIFYNYSNNSKKWEQAERDIQSTLKALDLPCRDTDNYVFLINIIRKKLKQITEEGSLDDVCIFIEELEKKFIESREKADEVTQ